MEIDIVNTFNRSVVEAEINSLNKSVNYLSVIKFSIDNITDLKKGDTSSLENLFRVIQEALNINKFIYLHNTFFIFLRDKKIHEANSIASIIKKKVDLCKIEVGHLLTNFEITELYKDDTVDTLIDRFIPSENIDLKYKTSENNDIKKTQNSDIEVDNFQEIINTFHKIYSKDKLIKVHNFYKGVNIFRSVKVVNVTNNALVFETNHIRAMILSKEQFTFIRHRLFSKVVKANIANVDLKNNFVYLRAFEYLKVSAVDRKVMRINPKDKIIINIYSLDNKAIFGGSIVDLSINSVSIEVMQSKIKLNREEELKVKFSVPNILNKEQLIISRAKFFDVRGNHIILNLFPSQILMTKLEDYITNRQKELVEELKTRVK